MEQISSDPAGKTSTRAVRLHGVRDLRLETMPRPMPGAGEVLLHVLSVGICGSDVHYYAEGQIGPQKPAEPIIMGHEFSARVAMLGPEAQGVTVGALVAVDPAIACGACESCQHGHPNLCPQVKFCGTPPVDGVFRDYTVMPAANCFPLPQGFSADEGALLEPLGVAIHAVDLAHIFAGQTIAVLGAGPIGLLTAAVARISGATTVYMTEPLAYRRDFAHDYVADLVLDPLATDIVAEMQALTNGRGVDVAFECAGANETPAQAAELVRPGGKVIVAGIPGDDHMTMQASTVRRKGLTIKLVRRMKHTYPRAIELVARGAVDVTSLVTHHFPLERLEQGFETAAGYCDGMIKGIVQVNS